VFCGDTVFGCGCGKLFEGTPAMMAASLDAILSLPDATRVCCAHEYTLSNIDFAKTIDGANPALLERERADRALRARHQPTLPSTLALEKTTNPFLRFHDTDMTAFAADYLNRPQPSPAEVFGAIRAAKDAWDG
jgi:hydroxyacylglutathione hydrolase